MAYTLYEKENAFNKDESHPEGYDYTTADDIIKKIVDTALGRFYFDKSGNAIYESRFHRVA